ncbi:hypothetical protein psyc5s11_52400 [Clostridium gelidum]|uniref:Copper amine oxidase-like N-terminal domain-containing protein n=1 Tax=Clostridium gelidum TaxID=704125 RepID=A0ABM7TB47_9CLOT|nr:DUF2334 domain-containing protein [Clostridium gelidum]BCZ49173.1 hypothetical protein psyc5s11_52400 [Clostridium gelidum]
MKRNLKPYIFSFLVIIICICIIIKIFSLKNTLIIINNTVYSSSLPKNKFTSIYTPKIKFTDKPVTEISGVTLNILNETNITNVPMLLKAQRYYIPLDFICNKLDYTIDISDNSILLSKNDNKVSLTENFYEKNSKTSSLRGTLIKKNCTYYICISDIEEIFNLIAVFDFKNNNISLIPSNSKLPKDSSEFYSDKVALIRLEDFACNSSNSIDTNQTKVKCMVDFLYSEGLKFHISWIPRFKSPEDNIDNDLLTNNNIVNVGFVNILDYFINKGGEIGLHGYTHQHGDEKSAIGEEMSKDVNNSIHEARTVIENGIDTASALNIPISYFESPHYSKSDLQRQVIEDYFQFIYESFDGSENNIYRSDDYHLFVPTPLGYVHNSDPSSITNELKNDNHDILHSFYYHPYVELAYINSDIKNSKLNVTYDENSPLQQIVKTLKSNKYTTVHIDELIDK